MTRGNVLTGTGTGTAPIHGNLNLSLIQQPA